MVVSLSRIGRRAWCVGLVVCLWAIGGVGAHARMTQDAVQDVMLLASPARPVAPAALGTTTVLPRASARTDTTGLVLSFGSATYRLVGDRVFVLPRTDEPEASMLVRLRPVAGRLEASVRETASAEPMPLPSRAAFAPAAGLALETEDVPRYLLLHHLSGLTESAKTMEAIYAEMGTAGLHHLTRAHDPEMLARTSRQMAAQARYATEIAQTLPLLEAQRYLTGVRERDETLFGNLLTEQALEERVDVLAASLGELAEGPDRAAQTVELRALLSHLFDLKQENRRAEAQQLQDRLDQLNERLDAQQRLKVQIVERRLRRLTTQD